MRCGEFKFNQGMATSAQFSYYGKPVLNIRGSVQLIFSGLLRLLFFRCGTYIFKWSCRCYRRLLPFSFVEGRRRNIIYKNVILISREVCATPVLNVKCAEIGDSESNSASIHAPIGITVNAFASWVVCCAADIVYLGCLPVCLVMRIMLGRRR